ncbi:MAG: LPS export ABC transporter periplasmic protein LptC [Geobacter sp.]|nr:LPS export ABC transporter periplasmic protein LptC [Geobacter sp.]
MRTAGKIRLLLALVIMAAIIVLAVVIHRHLPARRQPASAPLSSGRSADLALQGIRFTETRNGNTKWILLANRADYDTEQSLVHLVGVKLNLLAGGPAGDIHLTAAQAEYNSATKDVLLRGGVKATSSSGMEFTTASVRFLAAQELLTTDDSVKYSDGSIMVEGKGMEYRVASARLRVKNDVTAHVNNGMHR